MEKFNIEWINEYLEEEELLEDYFKWLEDEEDTEDYRREFLSGEELELSQWCKAKGYQVDYDDDYDDDDYNDYDDFVDYMDRVRRNDLVEWHI